MAWDKLKSLFVVTETKSSAASAPVDPEALAAVEADLLAHELPGGDVGALPPGTSAERLSGSIDFQALYDEAGVPNTDEVEALEKFLGGLDNELPQASKLAASKAFLGAIGKSPSDVVTDAGRKIRVVRAVEGAKQAATASLTADHQQIIAGLEKQIEEHRAAMEKARKDLEGVSGQCAVEEARLQGARVFFGHLGEVPPPPASAPASPAKR